MKQQRIKSLKGQILVLTGLHIGAGSDTVTIGGMDNPIIRNPVDGMPYIPGSSIKGKMRSLMEWKLGRLMSGRERGAPCGCGECEVCRVFGSSASGPRERDKALGRGPTRLIVRDAYIAKESLDGFRLDERPLVEEKHENSIDRITADANPRPIERVVPGTLFDFELSYRVIDTGDNGEMDEKNFSEIVLESLSLLQRDYLGGGGSRGNGRVRFQNLVDEEGKRVELPGANDEHVQD